MYTLYSPYVLITAVFTCTLVAITVKLIAIPRSNGVLRVRSNNNKRTNCGRVTTANKRRQNLLGTHYLCRWRVVRERIPVPGRDYEKFMILKSWDYTYLKPRQRRWVWRCTTMWRRSSGGRRQGPGVVVLLPGVWCCTHRERVAAGTLYKYIYIYAAAKKGRDATLGTRTRAHRRLYGLIYKTQKPRRTRSTPLVTLPTYYIY